MRVATIAISGLLGSVPSCHREPPARPLDTVATSPAPTPPVDAARTWLALDVDEPLLFDIFEPDGPWLVLAVLETKGDADTAIVDDGSAAGLSVHDGDTLDRTRLASLRGIAALPERAWMIGSRGPCHARVELPARVALVEGGDTQAVFGARLTGCPADAWAPVAVAAAGPLPEDMRWVAATAPAIVREPEASSEPPLASFFQRVRELDPERQASARLEIRRVSSNPPVVEVLYGTLQATADPCDAQQVLGSAIAVVRDGTLQPIACPEVLGGDCRGLWLLGAVVNGDAPELVVMADDALGVAVWPETRPESPPSNVESKRITSLPMPVPHDEDRRARNFTDAPYCDDDA